MVEEMDAEITILKNRLVDLEQQREKKFMGIF